MKILGLMIIFQTPIRVCCTLEYNHFWDTVQYTYTVEQLAAEWFQENVTQIII